MPLPARLLGLLRLRELELGFQKLPSELGWISNQTLSCCVCYTPLVSGK